MDKDLARARFQPRFLHKMDFMLRVIERCNIRVTGWFLVDSQDSKLRVIQDLARTVDLRVCEGRFCRHHEHAKVLGDRICN